MTERPPLPVYLVHYNAPDWVESACDSLLKSGEPVRVSVVHNGPGTLSLREEVRVIESGGNLGFAGAANLALRDWLAGDEEFCVVGSHDLHVAPDTLALLRQAAEADPRIGIAGPLLAHGTGLPQPEPGVVTVPWVSGTCMMLRRACAEEVGFFDDRYGSYAEDFDLGQRATRAGWRVVQVRSAVAHGLGTATRGQAPRRLANSVLFDLKHYGRPGGYATFGRLLLGVPVALVRGRPRLAAARLAAVPLAVRHLVWFDRATVAGRAHGAARASTTGERGLEVIVVAYGGPEMLRRALEPVRDLPVTVVDNSSLPEIARLCRELGCRYVDPGRNGGFAAGVNFGLAHRRVPGADVLLLNPDAVIDAAGVRALQAALRAAPDLASVGPHQVDDSGRPVRVTWPFPAPWGTWLDAVGLARLRPAGEYVSGAILLLRAEALAEVGPFDERFFLYSEEADWAYRARRAGWRHAVVDSVTAMHAGGGTSGDEARRQAHFHASQERFLRKHHGVLGWQAARAGQIVGDGVRSLLRHGSVRDRLRARLALYLKGPVRVEAGLSREKVGG